MLLPDLLIQLFLVPIHAILKHHKLIV